MRAVLRALFLMASFMAFSGCVDINLKSELPKVDYYELDNLNANSTQCGAFSMVALESIDIPQSLSSKNILYKDGNRIGKIEGINLSENLKSSIESMLIKSFSKHCIKVITPPFSGIKMEQFLRIKILAFNAVKSVSNNSSGDNSNKNDFSVGNSGDSKSDIAKVSLMFILHQNGTILQSGIITQDSAIDNFNAEHIFNALQDSTNKAINELINNITPK